MASLNENVRAWNLAEGGSMKKFLVAAAILAIVGIGCVQESSGPVTENKVLKTTNAIYLDIRTVVTDPEIRPMFSPKELEKMAELEDRYLDVVDVLKQYPDDAEAIQKISYLATEVLGIFEQVTYVEKVRPYVAAIRISIQILRNHL
jgi:hypothetical protein